MKLRVGFVVAFQMVVVVTVLGLMIARAQSDVLVLDLGLRNAIGIPAILIASLAGVGAYFLRERGEGD